MANTAKLKLLADKAKNAKTDSDKRAILKEIIATIATDLTPEAKEIVKHIEAKPATTKDHYGDYMTILSGCPSGITRFGLVKALIDSGGNENGINSALRIIVG